MEVVTDVSHVLTFSIRGTLFPLDGVSSLNAPSWRRFTLAPSLLTGRRVAITWRTHRRHDQCTALFEMSVKLAPGRTAVDRGWERLRLSGDGADRYTAYRLLRDRTSNSTIILFRRPDAANYLGRILDSVPLGEISLPGTHESCALYGFPVSQCQQPSTPVMQQLEDGIRFLDVRLRVVGDDLLTYHGPRPQRSNLRTLLETVDTFLHLHPTETVLLSIKEESPPFHPHFSSLVYQAFIPHLARWFLGDRIPTLGEVRGKGMLVSRFDRQGEKEWLEGMGAHPSTWPDSRREGFEWFCAGTRVRTQDWYRVKTFLEIPDKFDTVINSLTPTLSPATERPPPFTLCFTSASYFPLSLPTLIAKGFGWPQWGLGVHGINSRFTRWLLERIAAGEQVRACCLMDFYRQTGAGDGGGLAELLVMMNFLH